MTTPTTPGSQHATVLATAGTLQSQVTQHMQMMRASGAPTASHVYLRIHSIRHACTQIALDTTQTMCMWTAQSGNSVHTKCHAGMYIAMYTYACAYRYVFLPCYYREHNYMHFPVEMLLKPNITVLT